MKIKQKDVKKLREDMLKEQKGICPLCELHIKKEEAVLDHCHAKGNIRRVLHRHCNVIEGKFINAFRRYGACNRIDVELMLRNLADYQAASYDHNPIHYTHKTPQDKEVKALRRRLKKAKRPQTKQRLQEQIQALLQGDADV